jgi:hypothetical protein
MNLPLSLTDFRMGAGSKGTLGGVRKDKLTCASVVPPGCDRNHYNIGQTFTG